MSTIHQFRVQCVICSKTSEHYKITSYSSFGSPDLDFRPPPMYRGTMSYWIEECPYCGYINVSIEHPIDLSHGEIKKAREEIETGYVWESEHDKAKQFAIFGAMLAKTGQHHEAASKQFLRSAWFFDDKNEMSEATHWRMKAIEQAEIFFLKQGTKDSKNMICIYADMLRRAGCFWTVFKLDEYELDSIFHIKLIKYQKDLAMKGDRTAHELAEIDNSMYLAEIAENHYHLFFCNDEVEELSLQNLLAAIKDAKKYHYDWFQWRAEAIRYMTDKNILTYIAKNDKDNYVREEALKKLTDQSVLKDIAENDVDGRVCIEAAQKLTDQTIAQAVYAGIAKDDKKGWERERALNKLTDQNVLKDIAENDMDGRICIIAAQKLTDQTIAQAVYACIAKDDKKGWACVGAGMLTDQNLLADIAKNSVNVEARRIAVKELTDQSVLVDIVENEKNHNVRKVAIENENLTDQRILTDSAKNDTYIMARLAAADKLTDKTFARKVYINIANTSENKDMRITAAKKLINLTFANDNKNKYLINKSLEALDNADGEGINKEVRFTNVILAIIARNGFNKKSFLEEAKRFYPGNR